MSRQTQRHLEYDLSYLTELKKETKLVKKHQVSSCDRRKEIESNLDIYNALRNIELVWNRNLANLLFINDKAGNI